MATLFGARDRLTKLLQERAKARRQEMSSMANAYARMATTPQQAGINAVGATIGTALGQGFARSLFGESDAIKQAREAAKSEVTDSQAVQNYLTNAAQDPEYAEQYYFKAAEIANKYDPELGIKLANQAVQARDKYAPIRTQKNFTAIENAVKEEVDPLEDPIGYTSLMAERLSAAGDPAVQSLSKQYQDKLLDFGIAAAKENAKEKGVKYDAPEGTEVKSALSLISATEAGSDFDDKERASAAVELASRTKNLMTETPGLKYGEAQKKAWQGMQDDGTVKYDKGWFFGGDFEYASPLESSTAPASSTGNTVTINGKPVTIRKK